VKSEHNNTVIGEETRAKQTCDW